MFFMILQLGIRVIYTCGRWGCSEPRWCHCTLAWVTECTPRMKPNVNYRLWVTVTCQCWFISVVWEVDIGGGCVHVVRGVYGNSVFLLNFDANLKLL